jgi:hypothetical protein
LLDLDQLAALALGLLVGCLALLFALFARLLGFDHGGATDADERDAAGELGEPLLQLLAIIVGRGLLDLRLDLEVARLDVGLLPGAADDRGVLLVHHHPSCRVRRRGETP